MYNVRKKKNQRNNGATVQETFYKILKLDRIIKYIVLRFAC